MVSQSDQIMVAPIFADSGDRGAAKQLTIDKRGG